MGVRRKGREGEGTRRAVVLRGKGGDILSLGGVVVGDGVWWFGVASGSWEGEGCHVILCMRGLPGYRGLARPGKHRVGCPVGVEVGVVCIGDTAPPVWAPAQEPVGVVLHLPHGGYVVDPKAKRVAHSRQFFRQNLETSSGLDRNLVRHPAVGALMRRDACFPR